MATRHLYLYTADAQPLGRAGALVSLVHRRRSRTRVGLIPAHVVFPSRNDWHNGRSLLFWQQLFKWHADRVIVLCVRPILPR